MNRNYYAYNSDCPLATSTSFMRILIVRFYVARPNVHYMKYEVKKSLRFTRKINKFVWTESIRFWAQLQIKYLMLLSLPPLREPCVGLMSIWFRVIVSSLPLISEITYLFNIICPAHFFFLLTLNSIYDLYTNDNVWFVGLRLEISRRSICNNYDAQLLEKWICWSIKLAGCEISAIQWKLCLAIESLICAFIDN